jgi:hypothetical protein
MMRRCFEYIKQGLNSLKNSSMTYVIMLIRILRQHDPEQTLDMLISYRIPCLLIQFLDDPSVCRFLTEMITNQPAVYTQEEHDVLINHMIYKFKFFETILDMLTSDKKKMNLLGRVILDHFYSEVWRKEAN